jgi:hypothetical protein
VAGGGGGGAGQQASTIGSGGGGGAGGYLTGTTTLSATLSYTVVVGAGGKGGISNGGISTNGSNSQFGTLTASVGGGRGGNYDGSSGSGAAVGGSGGGGDYGTGTGAAGTSGQGSAGGNAYTAGAYYGNGGGGGAGAAGTTAASNTVAPGGVGLTNSISGTSTYYAGGGGGGSGQTAGGSAAGGNGGGGAGGYGTVNGSAGTANLGGGGGGAGNQGVGGTPSSSGGNGGAGVVIISYPGAQQFGGGVVTSVGGNTIHTFNTSGTLIPLSSVSASYLIVAGGGASGNPGVRTGGGGAGGLLSGSGVTIDTNSTYLVTVGAGGAVGASGANSAFSMVSTTAIGGGSGGTFNNVAGVSGGSGGGGGGGSSTVAGGSGTTGQGNTGGTSSTSGNSGAGGGGGGSSAVGGNASGDTGGNGGTGTASSISGTSTYYAGGGGGGAVTTAGTGGNGGGGAGSTSGAATAGTANTGGGGGGTGSGTNAAGGSGIVIISYAGSTQLMAGGTVTITGGNVVHTFTSSGYLAPLKLVNNSLRFRSSATTYLSRTPTVTSSTLTKLTFSAWVKRGTLGAYQVLYGGNIPSGSTNDEVRFNSSDQLEFLTVGGSVGYIPSTAVYRDPAAWYHIVCTYDSTQATSTNRMQMWVNGVLVAGALSPVPAQNTNLTGWNNVGKVQTLGIDTNLTSFKFDGYMTNVYSIDGLALTPNSFGTFNSYGVWQPINYGGSYGTNGFYLPFTTVSTSTYAGVFSGSNYISSNYSFNWSTGGNFTMEAWICPTAFSSTINMIGGTSHTQNDGYSMLYYYASGKIAWGIDGTNEFTSATGLITAGNWYHVAIVNNGGTLTIYLNGRAVASTSSGSTYLSNNSATMYMGSLSTSNCGIIGDVSNFRFVTSAVYTSNFTPSTTNLTAITNTQLLTFQGSTIVDNSGNSRTLTNNGTVTTSVQYPFTISTVFNDQSPAQNNWTPTNFSGINNSTYDYMTDAPTLTSATISNYAVLNPLDKSARITLSNANLTATFDQTANHAIVRASIGMITGKFYWEVTVSGQTGGAGAPVDIFGVQSAGSTADGVYVGQTGTGMGWGYNTTNVNFYASNFTTSGTPPVQINGTMSVAYDADNGLLWFASAGTWIQGNPATGSSPSGTRTGANVTVFPAVSLENTTTGTWNFNFGQQPFQYTPPTGFVALNTYNL